MAVGLQLVFDLKDKASAAFKKSAGKMGRDTKKLATDQEQALARSRGGWRSYVDSVGGAKVAMGLAAVGGAALAATMIRVGKAAVGAALEVSEYGDKIHKMSARTGLDAESLTAWGHAAELSGSSLDGFAKGIEGLQKRLGAVARGSKEGEASFTDYGIAARNADGSLRDAEDVLLDIADVMSVAANETEQAAIATRLLGRGGVELMPALQQGSDAIRGMKQQAHELGRTLTDEDVQAAADVQDAITRLSGAFTGMQQTALIPLLPALTGVADELGAIAFRARLLAGIDWSALMGIDTLRALSNLDLSGAIEGTARYMAAIAELDHTMTKAVTTYEEVLAGEQAERTAREEKAHQAKLARLAEYQAALRTGFESQSAAESELTTAQINARLDRIEKEAEINTAYEFRGELSQRQLETSVRQVDLSVDIAHAAEREAHARRKTFEEARRLTREQDRTAAQLASQIIPSMRILADETKRGSEKWSDIAFRILPIILDHLARASGLTAAMSGAGFGGFLPSLLGGFVPGFHSGGVAGSSGDARAVSPAVFAGAPRYHGGLASDEVAAVLQRGETVLSRSQSNAAQRAGLLSIDHTGRPVLASGGGGAPAPSRATNVSLGPVFGNMEFIDEYVIPRIEALERRQDDFRLETI